MDKVNRRVGCAVLAVLLAASAPALAGDAVKEAAEAALHADFAATGYVIERVHDHLHHVINCLVGPKGSGFDANSMNPCNGMGDGAIPDAADAATKKILGDALERANAGLGLNDLNKAKYAARVAEQMLTQSIAAMAVDPGAKETAEAALHANYAATASEIKEVYDHLHHVINCLVGPKGPGFDANSMNPCNGMGGGAIPDTADAAKKKILGEALEHANAGLGLDDLSYAQLAARSATLALTAAALAVDAAAKETAEATLHASYAETASEIEEVHDHLHHVINCLVGPKGPGFDANSMNPCIGMGGGAISDTADAAKKKILGQALEHAKAGLGSNDLNKAKDAAREAGLTLKNAM
jgi:hypothetical protein